MKSKTTKNKSCKFVNKPLGEFECEYKYAHEIGCDECIYGPKAKGYDPSKPKKGQKAKNRINKFSKEFVKKLQKAVDRFWKRWNKLGKIYQNGVLIGTFEKCTINYDNPIFKENSIIFEDAEKLFEGTMFNEIKGENKK